MTRRRMIQLSGVIVDLIYWIDHVPKPGSEATVHRHALMAGGGFNAMVAARRAGVAVAYAGSLGTGAFAGIAASALVAEDIETLQPNRKPIDQGCCTVLIDRDGERSFIAAEGADGMLSDADLAGIAAAPDDCFVLSGYALGYAGSRDALARWLSHDRPLVFDPSPMVAAIAPEVLRAALSSARWISANSTEAAFVTGIQDPAKAAIELSRARRGGGAIVRDGANGCFLATNGKVHHITGFAVNSVDTNGAGDAHVGAFVAGLLLGDDPLAAAEIANVTAALSTTQTGPSTAPTRDEAMAAMAATRRQT